MKGILPFWDAFLMAPETRFNFSSLCLYLFFSIISSHALSVDNNRSIIIDIHFVEQDKKCHRYIINFLKQVMFWEKVLYCEFQLSIYRNLQTY